MIIHNAIENISHVNVESLSSITEEKLVEEMITNVRTLHIKPCVSYIRLERNSFFMKSIAYGPLQ